MDNVKSKRQIIKSILGLLQRADLDQLKEIEVFIKTYLL